MGVKLGARLGRRRGEGCALRATEIDFRFSVTVPATKASVRPRKRERPLKKGTKGLREKVAISKGLREKVVFCYACSKKFSRLRREKDLCVPFSAVPFFRAFARKASVRIR